MRVNMNLQRSDRVNTKFLKCLDTTLQTVQNLIHKKAFKSYIDLVWTK